FLVRNVAVNGEVIRRGAEVRCMEIAVDGFEAISDAELRDEFAGDGVYIRPIQLISDRLTIGAKPRRRPDSRPTADVQPRDASRSCQAEPLSHHSGNRKREGGYR